MSQYVQPDWDSNCECWPEKELQMIWVDTPVKDWIKNQYHDGLYFAENIKENPETSSFYDIWLLTYSAISSDQAAYFTDLKISDSSYQTNAEEKCCMEDIDGYFNYGSYALEYDQNLV